MRKIVELPYNVVEGAQKRIITAFGNGLPVYLSVSGGKDSIVLAHLVTELIEAGKIDPAQLTVVFIDEEAIYPEIERVVKDWRRRFLMLGARFDWYCIECKHFNCFNQLVNDESFICWDSTKRDRWVRQMPSFAITGHPRFRPRVDSYQKFLLRALDDGISMAGVRNAESIQRRMSFQPKFSLRNSEQLFRPIFDWKDTDVWRYIRDHEIDFPDTYLDLYRIGHSAREMRLSQFFSIDTAKSLVRMDEHEPGLMASIIKREPNAYLASLYWDTELFRSSGGKGEKSRQQAADENSDGPRDYRAEVLRLLKDPEVASTSEGRRHQRALRSFLLGNSLFFGEKEWRQAYSLIVGGDPKDRELRALYVSVGKKRREAVGI